MNMGHNGQAGFTLLEMLAAMGLLAISFFIVVNSMGQSLHILGNNELKTRMALLARSLIDEHSQGTLRPMILTGRTDDIDWKLSYVQELKKDAFQLFRLELMLSSGETQERFISLRIQKAKFSNGSIADQGHNSDRSLVAK